MSPNPIWAIAGPCAAESEQQVLSLANALKAIPGVAVFRAGVWKPRTRPGGFEGMGERALPWLVRVQQTVGLQVCIEVATPQHVQIARRYGIHSFWIGARTTSDPFALQALAEAIGPTEATIYVKNPISPDVYLWLGAVERLEACGAKHLVSIHRGFYPQQSTPYRNAPCWHAVDAFRSLRPDIPILCDPSHMAGRTLFVQELAQQALSRGEDGLFVEVHSDPAHALSDPLQQLTPNEFASMLQQLRVPQPEALAERIEPDIRNLREEIDTIDSRLLQLLAKRLQLVRHIGLLKAQHGLSPYSRLRWMALLKMRLSEARLLGLNSKFIHQLSTVVHVESLRIQEQDKAEHHNTVPPLAARPRRPQEMGTHAPL